jgi:hypothetical protein
MRFRNFKYGIINLIKWFPVVWKDRDWDHEFILDILKFKLTNVENMFRHHGNHVDSEKDADNVHKAILYLDRMISFDYDENVFKHHDKKWGQIETKTMERNGRSCFDITRSNIKTVENEKKEHKEYRRLSKIVEKQEVQDYEMFFNHLKKHIRSWWD